MTFWQVLPSLYPAIAVAVLAVPLIWWMETRRRDRP